MKHEEFEELLHLRSEVEYLRSRKHHVEWLVDELNQLAKRLPRITATLSLYEIPIHSDEVNINHPYSHADFYKITNPPERRLPLMYKGGYQQPYSVSFPGLLSGLFEDRKNYLKWEFQKDGTVRFYIGYH